MAAVTSKEVGMRMRARREYLKITQSVLAKRVSTNRVTVGRWEKGEQEIGIEDLQRIADALTVPLSYFLPPSVDEWAEGEVAQFYSGLPPPTQEVVREMIRGVYEAHVRSQTTHGRKAE